MAADRALTRADAPGTVVRLTLTGDPGDLAATLRPAPPVADFARTVADLLADVRARGDAAIVADARRFGAPGFSLDQIRVPRAALAAAAVALSADLREAILIAAAQVRSVAEAGRPGDLDHTLATGQRIRIRSIPIAAAAGYVPGGRTAYPSSVIMATVPAQVAGVERIVIASPPGRDGLPAASIMAAAFLLDVDEVYAAGGAAAVGALAFGTERIAPVDVIVGPGSAWVQEAKRQVTDRVGIDGFAGPSEVMIVADASTRPLALALDLLAQAEHGPDSIAVLASGDPSVLDAVAQALAAEAPPVGRIWLVRCANLDAAIALAEAFAPEHLQLNLSDADEQVGRITRAGAVFLGPLGATAFGDYVAGSNHVLPTGGAARFASALGPATYMRRMSIVEMSQAAVDALTPHLAALADAEGYPHHRRSAEARRSGS